jgi:hypothetical protein
VLCSTVVQSEVGGGSAPAAEHGAFGATPIEPQCYSSHIALQACLEAAFIEPTHDVGLVEVFGTFTHKGKSS